MSRPARPGGAADLRTVARVAAFPVLSFVALMLLALVQRGPIVAVSTVPDELRADLALSSTTLGLLTGLPVLCFAVAAPLASLLIGRIGLERAVLVGVATVLAGAVVRSTDGAAGAIAGTVLIGVGITIGNVSGPVLIGRDFRSRAAVVTGLYTAAMNVSAMIGLLATGPLTALLHWRVALAVWLVLCLGAAVPWLLLSRRARSARTASAAEGDASGTSSSFGAAAPGSTPAVSAAASSGGAAPGASPGGAAPGASSSASGAASAGESSSASASASGAASAGASSSASAGASSPYRQLPTYLLTAAFAGQAFSYYALTAWLPLLFTEQLGIGRSASAPAASIFQIAALIGAFGAPVLINRASPMVAMAVNSVLWMSFPVGLLLAPDLWALWSATGGAAQGGGFTIIFTVVVLRSHTLRASRQLSAFVQTGGYLVACVGPTLLGGLRDQTGGWSVPLLVVIGALAAMGVLGTTAAAGLKGRR